MQTYLKLLPALPLLLSAGCAFEVRDSPAPVYSCFLDDREAVVQLPGWWVAALADWALGPQGPGVEVLIANMLTCAPTLRLRLRLGALVRTP